jgi:hypothetical protein
MKVFLNMKERPRRKPTRGFLLSAATVVSLSALAFAQTPAGEDEGGGWLPHDWYFQLRPMPGRTAARFA